MAVLKDVVFAYTKLAVPNQKYQTEGKENTEWTVDCIVSEKDAKAWKKKFKKQPPKEFENDEFEKIFKIKPPFPDQEEQFVVKLKKNTHFKDRDSGEMVPFDKKMRPKVLEKIGTSDSGKPLLQDVTHTKLVSNGSKGVAQYDEITNDFGTFAKLKNIRVDELIEYKQADNVDELGDMTESQQDVSEDQDDDSDFGSEDAPFDPDDDDDADY